MFKNEYILAVDIKKSMSTIIPIFVQYDSAELVFKIYDDGKSFDLTDFTSAEVSHKLPDGTLIIGYGVLETLPNEQKAVRYTYEGNEMSQPGFVSTSLSIYSTDKKVSILPFKVEIVGDTYEASVEVSPEVGILQQLITSVSGVSGQATQAAASANQAATSATQAVTSATQAVTSANQAVTSANQAITSANTAATNASDKAALANTAATNANTKATLADEKATLANQAATNANQAITNVNAAITSVNTAKNATIIATNNAQAIADNTRSIGAFNLSTAYLKNNIVTSNGSSWIALVNTQNNPLPTLPTIQNTWWRLLAQKGSDGAVGGSGTGTVTKINSVSPDGTGNVILTPSNIGAAPTTHAHTTDQVTGLNTALAAKYTKPANGIPSTDLTSTIRTSLSKADSALQSVADASTSVKGIVQLNNTLTSTSTSQAVTAAQAKILNDNLISHISDTTKKHIEIVYEIPPGASGIFFEKQGENPDVPDDPNSSDISSIIEVVNKQLEDRATNIKSSGAKADGSNSKSAIQDAIASSKEILIPSETFTTTDSAWIESSVTIKGNKGSKITQSSPNAGGDLVINSSDITIDGIEFEGSSNAQGIHFTSGIKNFELKNSTVKTSSQAIHINNPNAENIDIIGNDIISDSYGVLTNQKALHSKNINILFNNIYSKYSDAIELNNPNADNTISWKQAKIIGNTITSDEYGSGPQAGFAIGIANTRDVVIVGNIVAKSRLEALHIEDGQENIVVTGNVFNGCLDDGARIQAAGSTQSQKGKPVIISNNHFMKHNLTKTGTGIWRVANTFGVTDLILTSNYIRGFNTGMWLDGLAISNVEGSYIEDCNVAIRLGSSSVTTGALITANCDTLVRGLSGSIMDKVISKTPVTSILEYVGESNRVGTTLKAFSARTAAYTSKNGMNTVDLFKLPTYFRGKVIVAKRDITVNFARISCDVVWDGSTLTASNKFRDSYGAVSEVNIIQNGDNLAISFWTSSAWEFGFYYEFEGEFYQA